MSMQEQFQVPASFENRELIFFADVFLRYGNHPRKTLHRGLPGGGGGWTILAGGGFTPPRTGVELRLQLRVAGSRNHEPATAPKLAPCSIPFISKRPANLAQVVIHTKFIMAGHWPN